MHREKFIRQERVVLEEIYKNKNKIMHAHTDNRREQTAIGKQPGSKLYLVLLIAKASTPQFESKFLLFCFEILEWE